MAIDVTDDFAGLADGDELSSDSNWAEASAGSGAYGDGAGRLIGVDGANGGTVYYYTTAFDSNNVQVELDTDVTNASSQFNACGPMVVTDNTEYTGYYLRAAGGTFDNHNLEIYDNAAFQAGDNSGLTPSANETLKITVEDIGGGLVDIVGYADDVEIARLDAATAVGGSTWYPGIYWYNSGSPVQRPEADNFAASDVASGSRPQQVFHHIFNGPFGGPI